MDKLTTFRPASELPKSHRPPPRPDMGECGICGGPTLYTEARNLDRVPGFEHRKRGIACDPCVKRIADRRDANRDKMTRDSGRLL